MTREEYLKALIKEYGSQREFAKYVGIPHSTLFSILKNVGGASIDNIIKICKGLGISADDLAKMPGDEDVQKGYYTNPETAELARMGWTRKDLSKATNIRYQTLNEKMNGKSDFTLKEAFEIKKSNEY